ncbi:MAG: sulfatase-like hydrolase/transferase [Bacteroidota bacterium]
MLLIIADDLGIDAIEGYGIEGEFPHTPNLNNLRNNGLIFQNTWATPQCTPTRATIMSGKYGIKTGVMRPPGNLDLEHTSIFNYIKNNSTSDYSTAVFGKWHISAPVDFDHPFDHGADHFEGFFNSGVDDYYNWQKVRNGVESEVNEYVTSHITNAAIEWIANQSDPWFVWLAHAAPHQPFQIPPEGTYTIDNPQGNTETYRAMIESMDFEIGRLLNAMDQETKDNTIVIFIGDNGTPNSTSEYFPNGHAKGSMYEGGLRVPMLISGKNVERNGEIEEGLAHVTDLYATIAELTSDQLPGGIHNSLSLAPLLACKNEIDRSFLYSDYQDDGVLYWAIKNDRYKLIANENGNEEFYDLSQNVLEDNNLIDALTSEQMNLLSIFREEAETIRTAWSCADGIKNGEEVGIDDCNHNCSDVDELGFENIGCCASPDEPSVYYEYEEDNLRFIYSNGFPNHDYCYTNINQPSQMYHLFSVDKNPILSGEITNVVRDNGRPARYFGVAINGIIFAPAPAMPFIFENQNTGEFNWDWVFEPTNTMGDMMGQVSLDCASAHTGPQGYHYHGEMFEYVEMLIPGISTTPEAPDQVIHIGWAADGFPILYKFGPDKDGQLRELQPSFQLLKGVRPGNGITAPCGPYTGRYTRDYEYICGKGDLDECNGMESTVTISTALGEETFEYFYVISSAFPQIPRCLMGMVSPSFDNGQDPLIGMDNDGDGFLEAWDCDDNDASIHPNAEEIEGNDVDENCDGLILSSTSWEDGGFEIGPNPSHEWFEVRSNNNEVFDLTLLTMSGKIVRSQKIQGNVLIEDTPSGMYILKIKVDSGQSIHYKVLVQ